MVRRPERVAEEALWKAFWQNEGGIAPNDVMYRRAPSSPLIFDWVYNLLRRRMEERMNAGADHWVSELRAAGNVR